MDRRQLLAGGGASLLALSWEAVALADNRVSGAADALRTILGTLQTSAMRVLHRGHPVFEYGDQSEVSYLASARKSLVSMLYGPSVARGIIRLDRTLAQIGIDDIGGLLGVERQATVRDLLMARSGVYHPAANAGDAAALAPPRGSVRPGERFLYNNWDFNALGAIFEAETGRNLYRAFGEDIAEPAGLQDWSADMQLTRNDTGKSKYPAHHFGLSTRDMATLGQLMLDHGRTGGRQVIPAGWVRASTKLHTSAARVAAESPFQSQLGYGYLWWIFDRAVNPDRRLRGAFTATGAYGQFITVIPAIQMVVAHKTVAPSDRNVSPETYLGRVLPAAMQVRS